MIQAPIRRVHLLHLRGAKAVEAAKYRLGQVPTWIRNTVLLFVYARLINYTAIFVEWLTPAWGNHKVDLFLCPGFSCPMLFKWYVKYISVDLGWLIFSWACVKIAMRVSDYLFLVAAIFVGYHIIDVLMFVWNFQRYNLLYVDMMWTALIFIWTVFKGYRPETVAKVKSLF